MINSIELENWKTHGSTTISFSKGTNIIIGQMGAGKSSIMDAVSFALFGTFPAIKNRRVNVENLIRNKPTQQKRAKIRLSFTNESDNYIVEREIFLQESAKAKLQKNGAYLQSQPQRVTEEIEKALKMDYDLFSRAVYSEQNRLDYFLDLRAGDRKKQIDNLLGLDKFATAQENAASLINKIKDMIDEEQKTATGFDIEGLNKQLENLSKEKEKLMQDKSDAKEQLDKLQVKLKTADSELKNLKEKYNKKILTKKEIAELNSAITFLESEIEKINAQKLGEYEKIENLLKEKDDELKKLKEVGKEHAISLQTAQVKLGKLQADLELLKKNILEKEKLQKELKGNESAKIKSLMETVTKELEKLDSKIAQGTAKKEDTEKWIAELEKHISKCPVCERELSGEMKESLLDAKKRLIKKLENEINEAKGSRSKKKEESDKLTSSLNTSVLIEDKLKVHRNLEDQKEKVEKGLEEAKISAIQAKGKVDAHNELMTKINEEISKFKTSKETLKRREAYLTDKKKKEESMKEKQKEEESIDVDEKRIDQKQKDYIEIASDLSKYKTSITAFESSLEEKTKQINEKKRETEKINKIYEDIKTKQRIADNLTKFRNSLQEAQAIMRNKLVSSINQTMQDIWPELYPYGDYPSIMLMATEDDYILKVNTIRNNESIWEDVEAIASGGERSIACLAMRVAFALVLVPNLKWLILDEPTHNIDQLGISKFVRVFNEILPNIIDQIFIITHDEQLKQVSNGRIYVLSRKKEENKETITEEL